jgi:hypothetical protein
VLQYNTLYMFPVPECVVDALHLWEKERHRLVFTPCSLFRFAASHRKGRIQDKLLHEMTRCAGRTSKAREHSPRGWMQC